MTGLAFATTTGWQAKQFVGQPPSGAVGRITAISAEPGSIIAPPPATDTIFGLNALGASGNAAQVFGKVPIGRGYFGGGNLPVDGSAFQPNGYFYKSAMVGVAGVVSSKRANVSWTPDLGAITSSTSPLAVNLKNFCQTVPTGWTVQLVLFHEYNLGTHSWTIAQAKTAHGIMANVIMNATTAGGTIIPVINPAQSGFDTSKSLFASSLPPGTQFHFDGYDNPNGVPPGYKNYGTQYRTAKAILDPLYDMIDTMGFADAAYGWGIDEFNAPRRIAPKLATLDGTNGWGPLSPHDIDGSGQANSIVGFCNYALNAPVPATTMIIFIRDGTNWNQNFTTAGSARYDPAGALHQGWPVNVDGSKCFQAYQQFLDNSP